MTQEQEMLYIKTVMRLAKCCKHDPIALIIALAEENERYREKIHALEDTLQKATETKAPPNAGTAVQRPKTQTGTRPCTVGDTPGTFHRWVVQDRILLEIQTYCNAEERIRINRDFHNNGIIGRECSAKVIRENFALIEFSDGSVGFIEPRNVRFTDKEVPEE